MQSCNTCIDTTKTAPMCGCEEGFMWDYATSLCVAIPEGEGEDSGMAPPAPIE